MKDYAEYLVEQMSADGTDWEVMAVIEDKGGALCLANAINALPGCKARVVKMSRKTIEEVGNDVQPA